MSGIVGDIEVKLVNHFVVTTHCQKQSDQFGFDFELYLRLILDFIADGQQCAQRLSETLLFVEACKDPLPS